MIEQYDNTKSYDNREKMPIFNPIGGSYGVFPVTDKCERSATLMGDDYVKLAFEADERVLFEAFSFIVYDGKHYFLKEKYRPTPKGTYYDYAMTFVSAANMLSKSVFMRYYQVSGQTIQPEPEVNVNANLSDMVAMVVRSIVGASSRVPKFNNTSGVATTTVYANMIAALTLSTEDLFDGSELKTFSFESSNIEDVLTQIAGDYDTEWWLTETNGALQLHVCKCEEMVSGDGGGLVPATPSVLSDTFKYEDGKAVPYSSRGLLSVAYAQEWSNIPQRILPFGSDRNIVRKQAVDNLNDKEVYVSYGKRLRLTPGHTYTVKNKAGEDVSLVVGSYGEVTNESVTTGIEKTEVFDDIYPQGHYIVTKCELSSNGNYYTIEAQAVVQNADGTPQKEGNFYKLYSVQEANTPIGQTVVVDGVTKNGLGLVPILNKEQTEDLTIRFESGFLNGREFGVSRNNGEMVEIDGVLYAKLSLDIVPDGNDDEALSLPNETWHPQARTGVAEGDMFAIFNMDMPDAYVTMAEQRLAQAVYDKLQEYQASRPDVKCKSEPTYFEGLPTIKLGKRYSVFSELFGEVVYIDGDPDKGIDETQSTVFTSRVTAYSHSLTTPTTLEFTLASGRVAGRLADIEAMISDSSTELRGLEQRHINLSKRGWHDAYEITQMVDSLTTESMLVGNAKYQFQYTFGIVLDNSQIINSRKRTASVTLTGGGCIQHTQKPYIDYANQGIWYVDETEIDLYTSGGVANYDPTKAYYLYAKVNNTGARLTNQDIVLTETAQNGDMYMLLGILSSEFEDTDAQGNPTSFRVFSRTNGYSQINGGTITTEQIQDANRRLIIDFQHDPPRIVAVNGAEIIGKITFKSGSKDSLGNDISQVGKDVNDAKDMAEDAAEAAEDAMEKANNIADDGIISGGTEKATIKKEWQEIAGDNMQHNTNGSYKKALDQASEYGVTSGTEITNINTAYSALESAMHTIVGYSNSAWSDANMHIDTYLMKDDGTAPTIPTGANYLAKKRSEFSALWRAYYDAEIALLNAVSDVIDTREIGGENLANYATAEVDNMTKVGDNGFKQVTADTKQKLELCIDDYDGSEPHNTYASEEITTTGRKVYSFTLQRSTSILRIKANGSERDTTSKFNLDETLASGTKIVVSLTFVNVTQGTFEWKEVMIQRGDKATSYQAYYKYLADAFENDARAGTTEIDGGLLATSLIKLRNQIGNVTAGMSGLDDHKKAISGSSLVTENNSEGVTLWGGGTYAEALAAAAGNGSIPVLLTKTGLNSRIGCFRVISNTEVQVVSVEDGVTRIISIDTVTGGIRILHNGVEKIIIVPKTVDDYKVPGSDTIDAENTKTHDAGSAGASITVYTDVLFSLETIDNSVTIKTPSGKPVAGSITGLHTLETVSVSVSCILQHRASSTSAWNDYQTLDTDTGENYAASYINVVLNNLPVGQYRVVAYKSINNMQLGSNAHFTAGSVTIQAEGYCYKAFVPKTVVGTNGIIVANNRSRYFQIVNETSGQQVIMAGLPQSEPSAIGQVWNDNGILKIKT